MHVARDEALKSGALFGGPNDVHVEHAGASMRAGPRVQFN